MSVAPAEPTPTDPTPEPTGAPPAPAPAAPDPTPTEPPKPNPWDDPATAQAEIEKLRRENAKDRTTAKAQAAEEARQEFANTIGKALGIIPDGAETDPAKLTESLTTSQAEAKQARVELAVFKAAATAGGDPAALLDSSSFLASLAAVDPTDTAAVTAAIQSAVAANPRLGAAPAGPTPPAPNPAQGAGGGGPATPGQLTREQVAQMARDGNHEGIQKAREEGRLNEVLGIKS